MTEIITVTTRSETKYEVDTNKKRCTERGINPKQRFVDNNSLSEGEIVGISASKIDPGGCAKEKFIVFVRLDKDKGMASFYVGKNPKEMGITLL